MNCYVISACAGAELGESDLPACMRIIDEGEAVDIEAATENIPKALYVAIVRKNGEIVGVGAIKHRRPPYARAVASVRKSDYAFDENMHELGYVAVTKAHRGKQLSKRIVSELLERYAGPLFATTSNPAMKRTLDDAGFVQRGVEWEGQSGNRLSLWIKA